METNANANVNLNLNVGKQLLPHLQALVGFARKRVGDPNLAQDLVQDALLKAVQHAPDLQDEDAVVAWVYRILRNTISDALRRRTTEQKFHQSLREEELSAATSDGDSDMAELCRCITPLIDVLKPEYAEVLRDDLAGIDLHQTASRLGIDMGNLKVRRHRARAALRQELELTCRVCAQHGCLDCHCADTPAQ